MASTYTMVAYGSQGDAVRQLQSELNRHGYQLDEDGVFGKKTRAAVRDYQKKNSLRLDGIAGDETWGSLLASPPRQRRRRPPPWPGHRQRRRRRWRDWRRGTRPRRM